MTSDKSTWIGIDLDTDGYVKDADQEYHLTLAYLGYLTFDSDDPADRFGLQSVFANWVLELWPHAIQELDVIGFDQFGPQKNVLVATVALPEIFERNELVDRIQDHGFAVSHNYAFTPHVTIPNKYVVPTGKFRIKGVFLKHRGEKIVEFKFSA